MEIFLIVFLVIGVVVFRNLKAAAEEQQARQKRMQQQDRTRMTTYYTSPAPAKPAAQPAKPITRPVQPAVQPANMPFSPTEGIPFHPPGFHGDEKPRTSGSMEKKPLEKVDLGVERARQNAHTAQNLNWTAPQEQTETEQKAVKQQPMFTPKQLRDAFIMQEILDEPVARRKGLKRGYGS